MKSGFIRLTPGAGPPPDAQPQDARVRWDNERMPWPEEYFELQPFKRLQGIESTSISVPRRGISEAE